MFALPFAALLATAAPVQTRPPATMPARPPAPPAMHLEAQFRGPQQDTVVQRWRDPATNAICYIYLPITVEHSARTPTGYVQYGANSIGSISCVPGR